MCYNLPVLETNKILRIAMTTKITTALASGSSEEAAKKLVDAVRADLGDKNPVLMMLFASTTQPLEELMPKITSHFSDTVILAASSAGEFVESGDKKDSVALWALSGDFKVFAGMATGLKENVEEAVANSLSHLPHEVEGYPYRTGIMLLDPLSGSGEEAVLITAAMFGGDLRLAGGASGDDLLMKKTYVAYNNSVHSDGVVIALLFSKQPVGVGVSHGHKALSDPLRITRSSQNIVYEIEGQVAWDVWKDRTQKATALQNIDPDKLEEKEIGAFLLRYEAGLASGQEYKIRAPLARNNDKSLTFACGIPEGSVIRITESNSDDQICSAKEAARKAHAQLGDIPVAGALVFDCVCRKLILDEDFKKAIQAISCELGNVPLAGFETYGEIALDAGDMSGFHNTTTVVLAFS
jgi:methyl-accepting chemotaxis protein